MPLLAGYPVAIPVKTEFVVSDYSNRPAHVVGAVPSAARAVVVANADFQAGSQVRGVAPTGSWKLRREYETRRRRARDYWRHWSRRMRDRRRCLRGLAWLQSPFAALTGEKH